MLLKILFPDVSNAEVPADTPAAIRFAPKPYVNPQALLMTVGTSGSPEKPVRFPMYEVAPKAMPAFKAVINRKSPPLQTAIYSI